jgi:SAM-dependent methyltransferase
MILDFSYKLFRKLLPSRFYSYLRSSKIGREQQYFSLKTYEDIYNYYKINGLNVENKIICDLGSGLQYFTAFLMLNDGAEKVILIDPVFAKSSTVILKKHLEIFRKHITPLRDISIDRIEQYHDLKNLDENWNNKIDFICSYNVLEHFNSLESFFIETRRLLKPCGLSINRVDLSDHTYHIFSKYPFISKYLTGKELDYFRYSKKVFNLINDDKCYMNRVPIQVYLNYSKEYDLKVKELKTVNVQKEIKPHKNILEKFNLEYSDLFKVRDFMICFEKKDDHQLIEQH